LHEDDPSFSLGDIQSPTELRALLEEFGQDDKYSSVLAKAGAPTYQALVDLGEKGLFQCGIQGLKARLIVRKATEMLESASASSAANPAEVPATQDLDARLRALETKAAPKREDPESAQVSAPAEPPPAASFKRGDKCHGLRRDDDGEENWYAAKVSASRMDPLTGQMEYDLKYDGFAEEDAYENSKPAAEVLSPEEFEAESEPVSSSVRSSKKDSGDEEQASLSDGPRIFKIGDRAHGRIEEDGEENWYAAKILAVRENAETGEVVYDLKYKGFPEEDAYENNKPAGEVLPSSDFEEDSEAVDSSVAGSQLGSGDQESDGDVDGADGGLAEELEALASKTFDVGDQVHGLRLDEDGAENWYKATVDGITTGATGEVLYDLKYDGFAEEDAYENNKPATEVLSPEEFEDEEEEAGSGSGSGAKNSTKSSPNAPPDASPTSPGGAARAAPGGGTGDGGTVQDSLKQRILERKKQQEAEEAGGGGSGRASPASSGNRPRLPADFFGSLAGSADAGEGSDAPGSPMTQEKGSEKSRESGDENADENEDPSPTTGRKKSGLWPFRKSKSKGGASPASEEAPEPPPPSDEPGAEEPETEEPEAKAEEPAKETKKKGGWGLLRRKYGR